MSGKFLWFLACFCLILNKLNLSFAQTVEKENNREIPTVRAENVGIPFLIHSSFRNSIFPIILGQTLATDSEGKNNYQILQDGPSLNEKFDSPNFTPVSTVSNSEPSTLLSLITPPNNKNKNEFTCAEAVEEYDILMEAIEQVLTWYQASIDQLDGLNSAVGLQILEAVFEDISKKLPNRKPHLDKHLPQVRAMITQIVDQSSRFENSPFKTKLKAFGDYKKLWKRGYTEWKTTNLILEKKSELLNVGNDKETMWGILNGQCQMALATSCEVPYICQRTFLDPEPQSQYMLTHQVLYLLFAKQKSCDLKHSKLFVNFEERLDQQCAKVYQEAELISQKNYPFWSRDLFSEQVALCSLAGYPNFQRRDWYQAILSWQSPDKGGCFGYSLPEGFWVSDEITLQKDGQGPENCRPHFTTVSLSALAVRLTWLADTCDV